MPAEWEPHRATWISWPHHEPDWPGKLGPIPWVYAEITRVLAEHEPVEILCHSEAVRVDARAALDAHGVPADRARLHVVPTDRVWLRDSAPIGVHDAAGDVVLLSWAFNGWAKYDNWQRDALIARPIAAVAGRRLEEPRRHDTGERIVLEGGGIDVNGAGPAARDRGMAAERHPGSQSRVDACRLRGHLREVAGRAADAVAGRWLRRRRHARARR